MKPFEYLEPKELRAACGFLAQYEGKAAFIAGGTDLLVSIKEGRVRPEYVVDIRVIPDLDHILYERDSIRIGTLATLDEIGHSPLIREKVPILAETAQQMANPGIRNMATIGGNLCTAAPSADLAPPLIGLGATVKIMGSRGERKIPVEDFFIGPNENALKDAEILTEIRVPIPPPNTEGVYMKMTARTAIDIALVGVATLLRLDDRAARVGEARIVLGAVAPTPIRARKAEASIKGYAMDDQLLESVAKAAAEEAKPISDVRGSAEYRREMVKVLTKRVLKKTLKIISEKREEK